MEPAQLVKTMQESAVSSFRSWHRCVHAPPPQGIPWLCWCCTPRLAPQAPNPSRMMLLMLNIQQPTPSLRKSQSGAAKHPTAVTPRLTRAATTFPTSGTAVSATLERPFHLKNDSIVTQEIFTNPSKPCLKKRMIPVLGKKQTTNQTPSRLHILNCGGEEPRQCRGNSRAVKVSEMLSLCSAALNPRADW